MRGGTGETFDWELVRTRRSKIPLVLSGGLRPENVAEAIAAVRPFAVDTASGTEAGPGSRTPRRCAAFVEARRRVHRRRRSRAPPAAMSRAVEHRFGPYGGQYVPETLMPALAELEEAWVAAWGDAGFRAELDGLLRDFVGRPSPLYLAHRLSEVAGRRLYLKREDLNHTGAHKINNAIGQALLARRMGKRRIIAETGAGQHGVATATACALMDLECVVYMGVEDIRRQAPNVQRMELLGATRVAGRRRRADAQGGGVGGDPRLGRPTSTRTHYIIGSAVGPAPYPALVRDLQRVIGDEARAQILEREGRLPDRVIACVGGGSNAIGIFAPFVGDEGVALIGVEAGGEALEPGRHGAPLTVAGRPGVLHGSLSAVLQDEMGQILEAHSISAGLDYPGSGPEHAHLRDIGRATYLTVSDAEALETFRRVTRLEGIIPALETAHALHHALQPADSRGRHRVLLGPRRQGPGRGPRAGMTQRGPDRRGPGASRRPSPATAGARR